MASRKAQWVFTPPRRQNPKVPEVLKVQVQARFDELVQSVFRPEFVKPAPENPQFNYISDLYTRWRGSFFTFGAVYSYARPLAHAPTFEAPCTRLEYVGENKFNLAYMRYTGKWWPLYENLSLDECLDIVREQSHFWPPA